MSRRVRYIFPETKDFREVRPVLCWEHMYGWMDGYGLLFDPVVQGALGVVPEWENGWDGKTGDGDFFITSCHQATALFMGQDLPGLFIRPEIPETRQTRLSEKELLLTPVGKFYYPCGLPFDYYGPGAVDWMIGESAATIKKGHSLAVGFELFAMVAALNADWPERRLTAGADILAAMLAELGFKTTGATTPSDALNDLRLDFQAYGLNRLFIGWLLRLNDRKADSINAADAAYLKAADAWRRSDAGAAKAALKKAFTALATLRESVSKLDIQFLEYPHLGILFDDMGFFELEWPQHSRETLLSYLRHVKENGYKVSMEGGGSCWRNLSKRFPSLISGLAEAWRSGGIELTNGTFSLPYALLSPLALQYWQFDVGGKTFENTFGTRPETYQCQENSLTTQMPELLSRFGYKRALHISQNHGNAPGESSDFIRWASPAGHAVPSMTAKNVALSKKGVNYFLDLPLIHTEYKSQKTPLNYVNFQDIGYVPFRVHMIRTHGYANVWGHFSLAGKCFDTAYVETEAPIKTYYADAYNISANAFYGNETNANALSHYENVFKLWARFRKLRMAAWDAGKLEPMDKDFAEIMPSLCSLEAHDSAIVQGQRRGEFYAPFKCVDATPYSRETLTEKVGEIVGDVVSRLDALEDSIGKGGVLFNPSEVELPFAKTTSGYVCRVPAMGTATAPKSSTQKTLTLPLVKGKWQIGVGADGMLSLTYDGQTAACAPIDRKRGEFKLLGSEAEEKNGVNTVKALYQRFQNGVQSVVVEAVFAEGSPLIELSLNYAARNDFDAGNKWLDYLALEFRLGEALSKVWRFNPNVRSLTAENRIASPYYLAAETLGGRKVSILNEGSFLYEIDRGCGWLRWLFHVSNETRCHRRAALLFGSDDAFLLSRAWSQEVVAAPKSAGSALRRILGTASKDISFEDFVSSDTLLVSNLSGETTTIEAGPALADATDMTGSGVMDGRTFRLRPFELAELKLRG